jgi:hypothetical protein
MKASVAAERLGDLLKLHIVGDLLEDIGDSDVRDLLIKVTTKLRGIVEDEREAAKLA